jgi:hypothetical protein
MRVKLDVEENGLEFSPSTYFCVVDRKVTKDRNMTKSRKVTKAEFEAKITNCVDFAGVPLPLDLTACAASVKAKYKGLVEEFKSRKPVKIPLPSEDQDPRGGSVQGDRDGGAGDAPSRGDRKDGP